MAVTSLSANSLKEILFNMKMQLKHKGFTSSKHLLKNFLDADADKSGYLSREEFETLLTKSGIFLSRMDITYLMRHFDKNKDGKISFNEFYDTLVPELNERRANIVNYAWFILAGEGKSITIQQMYEKYHAANHPQVASGQKQEQVILDNFLHIFDANRKGPQGLVTEYEFQKAHKEISASYPIDDDAFIRMMECVWGITENKESSNQDIRQLQIVIKEKIRLRMKTTETEEQALLKLFKFIDLDRKGYLIPSEFHAALLRIGVDLTEQQVHGFFEAFNQGQSEGLDYSEFAKQTGGNNSYLFSKSTSHTFHS